MIGKLQIRKGRCTLRTPSGVTKGRKIPEKEQETTNRTLENMIITIYLRRIEKIKFAL